MFLHIMLLMLFLNVVEYLSPGLIKFLNNIALHTPRLVPLEHGVQTDHRFDCTLASSKDHMRGRHASRRNREVMADGYQEPRNYVHDRADHTAPERPSI